MMPCRRRCRSPRDCRPKNPAAGRSAAVRAVLSAVSAVLVASAIAASDQAEGPAILLPLDETAGISETYGRPQAPRFLKIAADQADTVDGRGAVHFGATTRAGVEGSQYFGIMVPLPQPTDLSRRRLVFRARTKHPGNTAAFYIRAYNRGESKPAWSFNSWNVLLTQPWREFCLQPGLALGGLSWEANVVEDRVATAVDRIEFIIGSRAKEVPVDVLLDDLRIGPSWRSLQELDAPHGRQTTTVLVRDGQARAAILHPDSAAGEQAAAAVADAVARRSGVRPTVRVGTAADCIPDQPTILLGNVDTNPALTLLYARYATPADSICPGAGGWLLHTVCDPFGTGANVIVAAASDDDGLAAVAAALVQQLAAQTASDSLALPRLFEKRYGDSFLKRFGWADDPPAANRLERGLKQGQDALDRGQHTSVAGVLRSVAERYQLTGHSVEAELFVALWELYADSAVADPRKYGGPWGFDSDFPAAQVVAGWDLIEDDPVLTDAQRLRTTKSLGRWLAEAVIPKCAGAAGGDRVPHNHQTFPGLGALFGGLYFSQHYDVLEGRVWLDMADAMFQRQAGYFKPYEDCNGYQWLTNGHLLRYCLARPHRALFDNGNGSRIIDYLIGTMDNLGYQVPYGDTGSWQCWNSELICLDMFAFATGSPEARWVANRKRELKNTLETHAFYQLEAGTRPDRFDGVRVWPLEPHYAATHPAADRPPLERCFDKISFREALDPDAAYLLLDGLSNGGHKHLDGNSLPRLTLFDRIWLADNDYFKAPVKFHNSLTVFQDGQSAAIPPYVELVAAGESPRYGYSRTRLANYAGADWLRTVIWLKQQQAFAVLDQLTARADDEYQFRALWHGVGAATLSDAGLLLTQQGPSLWIQIAPGPVLELRDDAELGANWRGYPHAEPMVRSLEAVATVPLAKGRSYLFASVLHGQADGIAQPWGIELLDRVDGVRLSTPDGVLDLLVDPPGHRLADERFETDAQALVVADSGLTLLGATQARAAGVELWKSAEPGDVDLDTAQARGVLRKLAVRPPVPNLVAAADAPGHAVQWCIRPQAVHQGEETAQETTWRFSRLASATLDKPSTAGEAGEPDTLLAATAQGLLFALGADGSTRWSVDAGCPLNDVVADDLTGDGQDEIILARQDHHVQVLNAAGGELWKRPLAYYRRPPYVNLVRTGDLDGDGTPEVIAGGENWRFYAFRADGTELWNYESVHPSRAGAVADLDGDGRAEVICGTHYYWASVLDAGGQCRWQYRFGPICYDIATGRFDRDGTRGVVFGSGDGQLHVVDAAGQPRLAYMTGDEVKHVATGDLDGDGLDEILGGSLNYQVYCFGADARRRWRLDIGGPVSALVTVPQPHGAQVVAGTGKGRLVSIDATGRIDATSELGSEIFDILAVGPAVLVATADGQLRRIATTGLARLPQP